MKTIHLTCRQAINTYLCLGMDYFGLTMNPESTYPGRPLTVEQGYICYAGVAEKTVSNYLDVNGRSRVDWVVG